jgi:hypothetical protein
MVWQPRARVILHPTLLDLNTGCIETFPAFGFIHFDFDHRWAQHGIHHDHTIINARANMTKMSWR